MKTSLYYQRSSVIVLFLCYFINTNGQTVIFSEDFSGFTTGTHALPSTSDASGSLDTKTHIPGWSGYKIYSAAGEIKIGIEDVTGWIETPTINFSGYEGALKVKFDICRKIGDATNVRVLQDGIQIGSTLTPGDNFETIEIPLNSGASSGKIKFEAISKRFYLDNISVISVNTPTDIHSSGESTFPVIYPNPARDLLTVRNITRYKTIEIVDISGKSRLFLNSGNEDEIHLSLAELPAGMYIIRFMSGAEVFMTRLVKLN